MGKLTPWMIRFVWIGSLAILFVPVASRPARGADEAGFFKGKTLEIIVSNKAGGGHDAYARLIAPALEKALGATVLVKNMPGGNSYVAIRHAYSTKPDGLTLILLDGMKTTMVQATKDPLGEGMDVRKFNVLGRARYDQGVMLMSTKSPFKTIADMKAAKRTIKFAGSAGGGVGTFTAGFIVAVGGLNAKILQGFGGSSEMALAAMKGEIDGFGNSATGAVQFEKQEEIYPLCIIDSERCKLLPKVPTLGELIPLSSEQSMWIKRVEDIMSLGLSVATTPGVPKERVQFLETVVTRMLTDKEFQAAAEKRECPIDFLSGKALQEKIQAFLNKPESELKLIKEYLLEKYFD
jgi:tripartite-type tricarboxylate transporter receptor subunit TctC